MPEIRKTYTVTLLNEDVELFKEMCFELKEYLHYALHNSGMKRMETIKRQLELLKNIEP